jgi:hypothetical protein
MPPTAAKCKEEAMNRSRGVTQALGWLVVLAGAAVNARGEGPPQAPASTAGGECVVHSCRLVPEVKPIKKTVYEVQEVPYCLKKLPPLWTLLRHRGCCETCEECECPRYRKVLVKKEVVCGEVCTTKCVVEEHRQPCPACR